jgi:hypothetical protein
MNIPLARWIAKLRGLIKTSSAYYELIGFSADLNGADCVN